MADKIVTYGMVKQGDDTVKFAKDMIHNLSASEIQAQSLSTSLNAYFNTMSDNSEIWLYTYNATTEDGWPETVSNNNLCRLTKINANYGFAKAWVGYNGYESRINGTGIQSWKKITP